MRWFDDWFKKKCIQAWNSTNGDELKQRYDGPQVVSTEPMRKLESASMNFSVYRANGGYIVETRRYDRIKDYTDNGLHIITDDKELGEEIGKIITYENLRN